MEVNQHQKYEVHRYKSEKMGIYVNTNSNKTLLGETGDYINVETFLFHAFRASI